MNCGYEYCRKCNPDLASHYALHDEINVYPFGDIAPLLPPITGPIPHPNLTSKGEHVELNERDIDFKFTQLLDEYRYDYHPTSGDSPLDFRSWVIKQAYYNANEKYTYDGVRTERAVKDPMEASKTSRTGEMESEGI